MNAFRALILAALLPAPLHAAPDCEALAARAGKAAGLPDGLLPAIARVESGRGTGKSRAAWPWTLNQGGKGMFFDTEAAALEYLRGAIASGVTNIDVGCMQLNYRWHGAAFASLEEMIDPARNVAYATGFMSELKGQEGSWQAATADYHSMDPTLGAAYAAQVAGTLGSVAAAMPSIPAPDLPLNLLATVGAPLVGGALPPLVPLAGS